MQYSSKYIVFFFQGILPSSRDMHEMIKVPLHARFLCKMVMGSWHQFIIFKR